MVPDKVSLCLIALAIVCALPNTAAADQPVVRLEGGYGAPQKWFGGVGLLTRVGRQQAGPQSAEDWYFETDASVGQGGWKLGAGLTRCCVGILGVGVGDTGVGGVLASTIGLQGVFTRTWGTPRGIEADRSLMGVELKYSLYLLLDLKAGVMFPLGSGTTKGPVFTWGVGLGLPFGW